MLSCLWQSGGRLLADKLAFDILLERLAVEVADGHFRVVVEGNAALADLADAPEVDHPRAVDAHEGGVRQPLLEFLHAHEHHHGAVSADEVDLQILAHALHATDVGDRHAHHLVLRLEEDVVVLVYLRRAGGSCFLLGGAGHTGGGHARQPAETLRS